MNTILTEVYAAFLPTLLQAIAAVLMLLMIRASAYAKERWNIEIEAKHREAAHASLMSGIRAALSRNLRGQSAIDYALAHAQASTPDAIAALKPAEGVLANIAQAKMREVLDASPFFGVDWGKEVPAADDGGAA
ncbi:hypothetical protein [Salipiger marinus]|uniref:hypothetical protein n=1 Tax=Salipiger marinus TaxID=555512 RepID=UPI004059116D